MRKQLHRVYVLVREDFGLTWNQALETGGVFVGKQARLEIEAEFVRQS